MLLPTSSSEPAVRRPVPAANHDHDIADYALDDRKLSGAFFTPAPIAQSLISWAVRSPTDRLLEPACGDGAFLAAHPNSVGIERDPRSAAIAQDRIREADVRNAEFFSWSARTDDRFDCAAGNVPFIRFQNFSGHVRRTAQAYCARHGASFSGLSSSWPMFLVAAASLLKPLGRIAFVVPAEIGHAPYAAPLLQYLVEHFQQVQIVAVREKLFPALSEDCWLLYADGFGGRTDELWFTALDRFEPSLTPPRFDAAISVTEWQERWNWRLRPFLLSAELRALYRGLGDHPHTRRLSDIASVGIGYITGANEFFHLRPSTAEAFKIPSRLLQPTVRNARSLPDGQLTAATLDQWRRQDDPFLLLRIPKGAELPVGVQRYLATPAAKRAQEAYKCRVRDPWYSVPRVEIPDLFVPVMSGRSVRLAANNAGASCSNSILGLRIRDGVSPGRLLSAMRSPLFQLSCELEGHAMGGGGLKLEPGEAGKIVLPDLFTLIHLDDEPIREGVAVLQRWRHYDKLDATGQVDHRRIGFNWSGSGSIVADQRPARRHWSILPDNQVVRAEKRSAPDVSEDAAEATVIPFPRRSASGRRIL